MFENAGDEPPYAVGEHTRQKNVTNPKKGRFKKAKREKTKKLKR